MYIFAFQATVFHTRYYHDTNILELDSGVIIYMLQITAILLCNYSGTN